MKLIDKLNEYFGTEARNLQEFLKDYDEEADTYEKYRDMVDFLWYLDRKDES